jgi:CubicO group peptidase (beta-lactamase class C family)
MAARGLLAGSLAALLAPAALGAPVATEGVSGAVERIGAMPGVRTVHVWRGEELLAARAFHGASFGPHDVKSLSKSVLSALVGIALERGLLPGLDAKLPELLPERSAAFDDPRKREIRLRHLLAMTSGLASTSGKSYGAWVASSDWARAKLARPMEARPGEKFLYSTGSSHLVATALARACRCDLLEWGNEVLFRPLGVRVASWATDPQGVRFGGNSFRIEPEALGRFGRLYLDGGVRERRRLVPAAWIEETTRRHADGWPDRYGSYGLLWWVPPFEERAFMAVGYGGQFLVVAPERRAVVVVTSTHAGKGEEWDRRFLAAVERELLPAVGPRAGSSASQGTQTSRLN